MKLADLPEDIQLKVLEFSNKIIRSLEGQPVELIDLIDKAVVAGMGLQSTRENSKAENLAQTLLAFRNFIMTQPAPYTTVAKKKLSNFISLVDQCLIENKPKTLVV